MSEIIGTIKEISEPLRINKIYWRQSLKLVDSERSIIFKCDNAKQLKDFKIGDSVRIMFALKEYNRIDIKTEKPFKYFQTEGITIEKINK